jgi:hypothetical protein
VGDFVRLPEGHDGGAKIVVHLIAFTWNQIRAVAPSQQVGYSTVELTDGAANDFCRVGGED